MTSSATTAAENRSRQGVLLGLAAYTIWGSFPIFFKALTGAAPLEIVCHRIFWSAVFLSLLVLLRGRLGAIRRTFADRTLLLTLCGSTLLIACNWLVFIYAVQVGEVLQSSLGYFITPLLSVLLGFLFLGERLSRWQQLSVLLALVGVISLTVQYGRLPWIALVLAASFGLYGLLRKIAEVDALIGLTVETLLLAPFALGFILYLLGRHQAGFLGGSLRLDLLLPLSGVVTAIPLLCFIGAARRLRLATIGFLQYITPSLHFLLAVGLYREPFNLAELASFLFIWAGLGVYSGEALWKSRSRGAAD
ncbi:EamA family transporter RarD [Geothermobacter hydrogeniphilus]|uniref:EamA family transporter n=1 Tax=Geothermobacter hydrogeniphilus TaxID=1969733 RepID=A0A1X0Y2C4_9BACT|nr:EamA family transporter RarD [Geothermobacter hydrogeniphilus]ORJ59313.1 EamA family transporter [Geothermobacter hydrogeniphilus]